MTESGDDGLRRLIAGVDIDDDRVQWFVDNWPDCYATPAELKAAWEKLNQFDDVRRVSIDGHAEELDSRADGSVGGDV